MRDRQSWLDRLVADGFLERSPDGVRLTRRWHAALARAAIRGFEEGVDLDDLRSPIAAALIESYGDRDEGALVVGIDTLLPLVTAELSPRVSRSRTR